MKISIITVCFNSVKTIADALASVRDQVLPDGVELEHIVVDGGSGDGTVEKIREQGTGNRGNREQGTGNREERREGTGNRGNREQGTGNREERREGTGNGEQGTGKRGGWEEGRFSFRWISEKDAGLYDAMNKGMKMATGEVIGIVNSDDMLNSTDVIARVAEAASDGTEVLGGCVRFVPQATRYADLDRTPCTRYVWPKWWRPWMLSWGWTPPHPGLYIRKSAYEKYGYYRADCEISADDEIIMRLVRKGGASYKYLSACTVAMRLGGKSTQAKNLILQNRELVQFNRDNGYWCCLAMMFPKMGIKALEILVPKVYHLLGRKL